MSRELAVLCVLALSVAACGSDQESGWDVDETPEGPYSHELRWEARGCCDVLHIELERVESPQCIRMALSSPQDIFPDSGYAVERPSGWSLGEIRLWETSCGEADYAADAVAEQAEGRMWFESRQRADAPFYFDLTARFDAPAGRTVRLNNIPDTETVSVR